MSLALIKEKYICSVTTKRLDSKVIDGTQAILYVETSIRELAARLQKPDHSYPRVIGSWNALLVSVLDN